MKDILKEDYQKALKTVTSVFLSNSVPFNKKNYQKQKGHGTSDQWQLGYKASSKRFLY